MHVRTQHASDGVASPSLGPVVPSASASQLPLSKKRSLSSCSASLSVPNDLQYLRSAIRVIPDFPKPGVSFKDITPLLRDPVAYNLLVQAMKDCVLSIEGGVHSMFVNVTDKISQICDDLHSIFSVRPSNREATSLPHRLLTT